MNAEEWRKQRDDRTLRYPGAGRTLATGPVIAITGNPQYLATYAGQVAVITAANLLGRMSPWVLRICVPSVPMVSPLPWAGNCLTEFIMKRLDDVDPYGNFVASKPRRDDYVLFFGPDGGNRNIHGAGWESFYGAGRSPIVDPQDCNPVGAALAGTIAVSELFSTWFTPRNAAIFLDAYSWSSSHAKVQLLAIPEKQSVGNVWTVGTGSVGTAVLYFLTLSTRNFSARLFDMDKVDIHNLDRSPIFVAGNEGRFKAAVTEDYLKSVGMIDVAHEPVGLDESRLWRERSAGSPDLLVSSANERNVRYVIETNYPPLQIYGTTGRNWQASVLRHVPIEEPCSCCLFPPEDFVPTECSTGSVKIPEVGQVDASLPFLSFGAGIMAVAEILKFAAEGFSCAPNRVIFNAKPQPRFVPVAFGFRTGCVCGHRNGACYEKMLEGGLYRSRNGAAVGF